MSWGVVAVAGTTALISSYGSNQATAAGKRGAKKAFNAFEESTRAAQGIISEGYGKGQDIVNEKTDKAQGYQDPYVEIGLKAKDYFSELDRPGGISRKYKEYLEVGDPLYDYANKKTSEALNRKMSALGRSDSGSAIERDLDRSTKLSYEFSDLADRRVQQDIGLHERLLGRGQHAADQSTNLQYNAGQSLSNLFTREADINASYEASIGGAGANMHNTMANLDMTNIGNQTQALSGFVSGASGALQSGAATTATGGTLPTGTISKATTGGGSNARLATMPTIIPGTGGDSTNLFSNFSPTNVNVASVAQARTAQDVPPPSTQNFYSYNPNSPTWGGQ